MSARIATDKLKKYRAKQGWTQERLAAEAGVSTKTVRRAESEDSSISFSSLAALADALEIDVESLQSEAFAFDTSIELPAEACSDCEFRRLLSALSEGTGGAIREVLFELIEQLIEEKNLDPPSDCPYLQNTSDEDSEEKAS